MTIARPQYITDNAGERISVILPIKDFEALLEELEDLDDINAYNEAKKEDDGERIPMADVFRMIEEKRKNKS